MKIDESSPYLTFQSADILYVGCTYNAVIESIVAELEKDAKCVIKPASAGAAVFYAHKVSHKQEAVFTHTSVDEQLQHIEKANPSNLSAVRNDYDYWGALSTVS